MERVRLDLGATGSVAGMRPGSPLGAPRLALSDLIVHDGAAFASSLDVARVFGKRHDDVMRKLRNIIRDEPEAARSFAASEYTDPTGRTLPCYEITRDGFTRLGMGFTGIQALRFKLAYIAKFNAMEAGLRQQAEKSPLT